MCQEDYYREITNLNLKQFDTLCARCGCASEMCNRLVAYAMYNHRQKSLGLRENVTVSFSINNGQQHTATPPCILLSQLLYHLLDRKKEDKQSHVFECVREWMRLHHIRTALIRSVMESHLIPHPCAIEHCSVSHVMLLLYGVTDRCYAPHIIFLFPLFLLSFILFPSFVCFACRCARS